jgi:thioredoxin-related protein
MTRLRLILIPFLLLVASGAAMAEPDAAIPPVQLVEATDLLQDGRQAEARHLPLLIMFSMEGCAYCEIVREEFLKPMLRNAEYRNKVLIREIHSDSYASLRDFDGKPVEAAELAHRYRASLSPTVVFLDPRGRELAERLVGVTTRDYYGGFLDEAIEQSLQRLRHVALTAAAD